MRTTIPWNNGSGNIILDYASGEGDDTIAVSSDSANDIYEDRSQTIVVKTTNNAISRNVVVTQGMKHPNFKTSDGLWVLTSDNKYFNVKEQ